MESHGEESALSLPPDQPWALALCFLVVDAVHAPNCCLCSYSVWLLLTFTFIIRCSVLLQRSRRWFYIHLLQITRPPRFSKADGGILISHCINSIVFQMFLKKDWNVPERTDPSWRICRFGLVFFVSVCMWLKSSSYFHWARRVLNLNT